MTKTELAQKRNYFKYILTGLPKPIDLEALTGPEKFGWNQILNQRDALLSEFNKHSQELGLKVYPKCWCGKIGKYVPEYIDEDSYKFSKNSGLVCKHHIKEI